MEPEPLRTLTTLMAAEGPGVSIALPLDEMETTVASKMRSAPEAIDSVQRLIPSSMPMHEQTLAALDAASRREQTDA